MIDALIGGRLYGKPASRTSQQGKTYVTAKVKAAAGDGDTLLVNVITFSDSVSKALLALDDGDSITLSGALTPKVWTPPNGEPRPTLDLVAHQATTPYHVTRKRAAVAKPDESKPSKKARAAAHNLYQGGGELESDLPWDE